MDKKYQKDEFELRAEEFPQISENFSPPLDEEFQSAAREDLPSLEFTPSPPEITPPGFSVPPDEEQKKRRRLRSLVKYLAAVMLLLLVFTGPLRSVSAKQDSPEAIAEKQAKLEELIIEGGENDPEFNIFYAFGDGETVRYYYVLIFRDMDVRAADVSQKVVTLSPYREAFADPEIDRWEGSRSRSAHLVPQDGSEPDYEGVIDVSSLPRGEQYLVLTATFIRDGEEKQVSAVRKVQEKPPVPETGATVIANYSSEGATMDYHAWLMPQEGDETEYDFEINNFMIYLYDENGEYCGASLVRSTADPSSVDPEEMTAKVIPPEILSDGTKSSGWQFVYNGPANLYFWEGIKQYTVYLEVYDKTTGVMYEIETDRQDVIEEHHVIPTAKVFLTSYYSEFHFSVDFENMDDVTKVTFEFWNPDTDTLEQEKDITKEALTDGFFRLAPFSTDFVYENHEEYYEEIDDFPWNLIAKVRMEYNWDYGTTREIEFGTTNVNEVGWEAGRTPEYFNPSSWTFPGDFQIYAMDSPTPYTIVYGGEDLARPNQMAVRIRIDGEEITYSESELAANSEDYTYSTMEDGEWVDKHGYRSMLSMPCPEKCKDGKAHEVVFEVAQYLTAYGECATFESIETFIWSGE